MSPPSSSTFYTANNSVLPATGIIYLTLTIGSTTGKQKFHVCDVDELILGMDAIIKFDIVIHRNGYTTGNNIQSELPNDECKNSLLKSKQHMTVLPGHVALIRNVASTTAKNAQYQNSPIIVDPCSDAMLPRPIGILPVYTILTNVPRQISLLQTHLQRI